MTGTAPGDRVLETARLRLRPVEDGDAARVVQLMTPAVSGWLASWPCPLDEAWAARRLREFQVAISEARALCDAIERRDGDGMIGLVMIFRSRDDMRRAGLGYWLGEAYHHQGYMREAVAAAVADAFERLAVDAIEAGAQPANAASLAIMRGLGMRAIGERAVWASARQREERCAYYEITRREHAARLACDAGRPA